MWIYSNMEGNKKCPSSLKKAKVEKEEINFDDIPVEQQNQIYEVKDFLEK